MCQLPFKGIAGRRVAKISVQPTETCQFKINNSLEHMLYCISYLCVVKLHKSSVNFEMVLTVFEIRVQ